MEELRIDLTLLSLEHDRCIDLVRWSPEPNVDHVEVVGRDRRARCEGYSSTSVSNTRRRRRRGRGLGVGRADPRRRGAPVPRRAVRVPPRGGRGVRELPVQLLTLSGAVEGDVTTWPVRIIACCLSCYKMPKDE